MAMSRSMIGLVAVFMLSAGLMFSRDMLGLESVCSTGRSFPRSYTIHGQEDQAESYDWNKTCFGRILPEVAASF